MNPNGFHSTVSWGFWILGSGILLTAVLLWCQEVNRKLKYILARLHKLGKGAEDLDLVLVERSAGAFDSKMVPPLVAVSIIGIAVVLLFLLPLWFINR